MSAPTNIPPTWTGPASVIIILLVFGVIFYFLSRGRRQQYGPRQVFISVVIIIILAIWKWMAWCINIVTWLGC